MKNSCVFIPTVKTKDRGEVESKLFKDLLSHTNNDRTLSGQIYAATKMIGGLNKLEGIKYDKNGEPTYNSLNKAIGLDEIINGNKSIHDKLFNAGIITDNGADIEFDKAIDAYSKAIAFNESNSDLVGVPQKRDGKFIVNVSNQTAANINDRARIRFKNDLNNKLLTYLNNLGFDVSFMEDSKRAGLFDPTIAETNASGLKTIIGIAKGDIGEQVFPEEFAHVIVAGMEGNGILDRLRRVVTSETAKTLFGEDLYNQYIEEYSNGKKTAEEYVVDEAIGRLLADYLKEGNQDYLLNRFWMAARAILERGSTDDIDSLINEAKMALKSISEAIESGDDTIVSKDAIMTARSMAHLTKRIGSMRDIAEESRAILAKKITLNDKLNLGDEAREESMAAFTEINKLMDENKNAAAVLSFMYDTAKTLSQIQDNIVTFSSMVPNNGLSASDGDMIRMAGTARTITQMRAFNDGYADIMNDLMGIHTFVENGTISLDEATENDIQELATQILGMMAQINSYVKDLRFDAIKTVVQIFYGNGPQNNLKSTANFDIMSAEQFMQVCNNDITAAGRLLSSLGESTNPIASMVHRIVTLQQSKRNRRIMDIVSRIENASKKLTDKGYSTDFIYQRDEDGIPTGWLIGPYDMKAFYDDREAYKKTLEENPALTREDVSRKMYWWDKNNTKSILVDEETGRKEDVPKNPKYASNAYDNLDDVQKAYYDELMAYKAQLESMLPGIYRSLYRAPQMRNDLAETFDPMKPVESAKLIWSSMKESFIRREDEQDFGEEAVYRDDNGVKHILLDFDGEPIRKVPIYFANMIHDKRRLNTDFTRAMNAYASMCVNYDEMSKITDMLEMIASYVKEQYETPHTSGNKEVQGRVSLFGRVFTKPYLYGKGGSNLYKAIRSFIDANVYGKTMNDLGETRLDNPFSNEEGESKTYVIDHNTLFKSFMAYGSIAKLGVNLFSGLSNVTMGETQMYLEATAGEFFGLKDLAVAKKNYLKDLPKYLENMEKRQKSDKMSLLMTLFNMDEDAFRKVQERKYNNNFIRRVLGDASWFFLQTAGEHKLHVTGGYAMLYNTKLYDKSGKEVSNMYDALEVVKTDTGYTIRIKPDMYIKYDEKGALTRNLDASGAIEKNGEKYIKLDNDSANLGQFFDNMSTYINRVNAGLHGGYAQTEKGAAHMSAVGKLLMQFRQWMPGHYNRRFAKNYYDPATNTYRAGFYRTAATVLLNIAKDAKRGKFNLVTTWNNLDKVEKANMLRAFTELRMFVYMMIGTMLGFGEPRKEDGYWGQKLFAYQFNRLKTEIGASFPINVDFLNNAMTIIQTPAAAIESLQDIINIVNVSNMFDEIESGRYEGWSKWERDAIKALPLSQIIRIRDLSTEDYIFNIYRSNGYKPNK